jgi:hypothetical protein
VPNSTAEASLKEFESKERVKVVGAEIDTLESETIYYIAKTIIPNVNDRASRPTIAFLVHDELQQRAVALYALLAAARAGVTV